MTGGYQPMARYDVQCTSCGLISEAVHSITEPHPPCVECGGENETYIPMGTSLYPAMSNQGKALLEERRTIKQLTRG